MTKTLNMIEDWKQEIAVAWLVKQALMEVDQEKIWPYHLPEIAATEADIKEAEAMLGFSLDERYRGFLLHANGWRGFWHTADLFGTSDLVRGPRNENAEFVLAMLDIPHLIRLHPRAADPGKFLPNAAAHEPVITELAFPAPGSVIRIN